MTRGPERFAAPVVEPERPSWARALGAGVVLLALVVGIPVLLLVLTGAPPFPDGFPGRDELTQPLSTDALFAVLRAIVWLAWLQFTICTVVEVVSIVRGGGLPRPVPFSGPSQALARALVGTVLIGSSVFGTAAAATAAAVDPVDGPVGSSAAAQAAAAAAVTPGPAPTASVDGPGAAVASSVEQATRMVALPGVPSSMTDVIGHRVAVVQAPDGHYHDNLWDIAERHLDDGRRWKEIYELNKGREQPDGGELVIGRLIQPGWVLIMPDDARGLPRVEAAPLGGQAGGSGGGSGGTTGAATAEAGDVSGGVGAAGASSTGAVERSDDASAAENALGGALVASMLALAVAAERRRRLSAAASDADLDTEVALLVAADDGRTAWIDQALRSLSATCRASRTALPQVYAATVSDDTLRLRVAPPMPTAPTPWSVLDDGGTWQLDRDADLPDARGHAPFPGLVCLGRDDDGADVLVDLEAVGGVLAIDGSHQVAREVVSAIAVQLATAPWADAQTLHGYDLSSHLDAVAGGQYRTVGHLGSLLDQWRETNPGRPAREVLGGRIGRRPGVQPQYLLLGSVPSDDDSETELAALGAAGTRGVGIVSAVPVAGSRWRVRVDEAGRLTIPLLDLDVRAVRLTDANAAAVGGMLTRARDDQSTVTPLERPSVPEPSRPGGDTEWRMAEVSVSVLGPVVVRGAGQIDPSRLELATEMAVFLALQPAPVHPSVVAASIWPRGVTPEVRDATVDRVREWLGSDADGHHRLGETEEGRLFLTDSVRTDWHALCTLLQRSRDVGAADERDLLGRALRLVRGTPLAERPSGRYSWLPRTRLEHLVVQVVVDAAHRLAVLSFDDDPAGAAAACRAGLTLAPGSQVLWRDLLLAESLNPDGPGTEAAVREMMDELTLIGASIDAETDALVVELVPDLAPGGAA